MRWPVLCAGKRCGAGAGKHMYHFRPRAFSVCVITHAAMHHSHTLSELQRVPLWRIPMYLPNHALYVVRSTVAAMVGCQSIVKLLPKPPPIEAQQLCTAAPLARGGNACVTQADKHGSGLWPRCAGRIMVHAYYYMQLGAVERWVSVAQPQYIVMP